MRAIELLCTTSDLLHLLTIATFTHSALTNKCEVMFSDDYWTTTFCGGMGVVNQPYTLSSSGSLTADHNGPIICATGANDPNGEQYTGFQGFNEYILQSNGSLMWKFYNEEGAIVNELRFWYATTRS